MAVHRVDSNGRNSTKSKFSSLAKKRLIRLVTLYPKALISDDIKVVHNLRVASRRLQQVLQLLLPEAKSSAKKKVLRTLRKVRRAFGPCRNLDVNLSLVRGRMEKMTAASVRQAWAAVQLWLEERRAGAIETGRTELRKHELVDLIARLQSLLEDNGEEAESMERLWERTNDALREWRNALDAAKADPAVQRIHAFRIAGKKLRYRVELLGELGNSSVKAMIDALKSLQDDLGDWHDHAVLRDHVGEFMQRPGFMNDEPRMCRALLREMERDKQRDRALIPEVMMKAEKLAQDSMQLESKEPTANDRQKDQ
jgi:CHAD domain-containing protein